MSTVAQLGEDLEQATQDAGDCLVHAHVANCVLDPRDPLYGDKHPPFGVPGGVYTVDDAVRYIDVLEQSGFYPSVSLREAGGQHRGAPRYCLPSRNLEEFKMLCRSPGTVTVIDSFVCQ